MIGRPLTGLVLGGGGARAAYQVGVLRAIMKIRREARASLLARSNGGAGPGDFPDSVDPHAPPAGEWRRESRWFESLSSGLPDLGPENPFDVICGTSAGAINAAALATRADQPEAAVEALCQVWENFSAEQVYRADLASVARHGAQWMAAMSMGWMVPRWNLLKPKALLDNTPLGELLREQVPFHRLQRNFDEGHLLSLSVSASSYTSGEHLTFYQSAKTMDPWSRSQRRAVRTQLSVDHLLASSAIPFVFPSRELSHGAQTEWFGDGSMRQTAPISPAIHLGAERVMVIGVGRLLEPQDLKIVNTGYPSLAQVAGHAMSSIFLDGLAVDIERMERINRTLSLLPASARAATPLRPVEALVIAPSQRIDDIAARHIQHLPWPVRTLLRGVGVKGRGRSASGSALASYLLFEAPYTKQLMNLGEADAMGRRHDILRFFGWDDASGLHHANALRGVA